ncbi:hypothetical protein [Brevundimonas diminuta]|uniref:hypothetical protein n=1 Tax=Brevundimonas diminuta TaxID=293 RepID=UPI0030F8D095
MTRPPLLACLILSSLLAACQPRPEPAASAPVPTPAPSPAREPEARRPEGPDMAPQPVPIDDRPCLETLGEAAAARLVQRCIAVSPATRPPCHASNPCDLIQGEIDRSCAMWTRDGETPPKECKG